MWCTILSNAVSMWLIYIVNCTTKMNFFSTSFIYFIVKTGYIKQKAVYFEGPWSSTFEGDNLMPDVLGDLMWDLHRF